MRTDQQILDECKKIGAIAVEAGLKTGLFNDNPTPAHEWLLAYRQESADERNRKEMSNTRWALRASWIAVGISLIAVISQMYIAGKQRELMREQLGQQQKDSQEQRDNAKTLLSAQLALELDKHFDSPEMRHARRTLATQLLKKQEVTDTRVLDFFDQLAMYTHKHLLDQDITYQSYSYWIERYWPAAKTAYVDELRKTEHDPSFYADTEELYNEALADDKKDRVPLPSRQEIRRFLQEEASLPR